MIKENISDLSQAADELIDFVVSIDGVPLADVAEAYFIVFTLTGVEAFRLTLGSGITFSQGTLSVLMPDATTIALSGKYHYELWVKDSQGTDTPLNYGTLKFRPTFGRY